ncbi:putative UDP-glycosyltransferase 84A3 [Hypsibius exemplaris]|uniref:UDP-glucuronosyltransferase n=1 Tax=Hypsibius exemplaris TaxID=2072580 RepID=A0A1W0X030_HYPEX|nr:putative UDP-glycosyltransferase 84A3 [Hypsibius exemplaris]
MSTPMYGHAIPLLELALKLTHFHRITFAVSASTLDRITKDTDITAHGSHGPINFIAVTSDEISDGRLDEPAAHAGQVLQRFEGLFKVVRTFLLDNSNRFAAVIVDSLLGGPASVLYERHIPYYLFNASRAWLTQTILTFDIDEPEDFVKPDGISPSFNRRSEGYKYIDPFLETVKTCFMEHCKTVNFAEGLIINSVREAEEETLMEIARWFPWMKEMKTFCVGPLNPRIKEKQGKKNEEKDDVQKWLDTQDSRSVIYISFGSIAVPKPDEIMAIGEALLQLTSPVVWSLKKEYYVYLPVDIQSELNKEGCKGNFVIVPWAPQKAVLAHPAVKVFISHCGWNSTLEALSYGVPVVCWPMFADQLLNADFLASVGVGKVLQGTGQVSVRLVPSADIASAVNEVTNCKNTYVENALQWKAKIFFGQDEGGSFREELLALTKSL